MSRILTGIVAAMLAAVPASAQQGRVYVSRIGSDWTCLVRRGMYARNAEGTYDRTPWFRALPMSKRRALFDRCVARR